MGVVVVLRREWALLLPAYSIVLVLLTYFTYFALALADTPSFSDVSTITGAPFHAGGLGRMPAHDSWDNATDPRAHWPDPGSPDPYIAAAQPNAIPVMYDLPIGLVNRVIYSGQSARSKSRTAPTGDCPVMATRDSA